MSQHTQQPEPPLPTIDDVPGLRPLLVATCVAQFFVPFLFAAVTPLLPAIGQTLHASAFEISLFNSSYSMALAIFHLPAGRLGDIIGHKRMLLIGLDIMVGMTLLLPFIPGAGLFAVCRFIQATGTAMTNTASLALLTALTPSHMRGQMLGTAVIGVFLGISIGPVLSGVLAEHFGWQSLFYCLVPLGIAIIFIVWKWVPEPVRAAAGQRFDWLATSIWLVGIASLASGAIWCKAGLPAFLAAGAGFFLLILFTFLQYHAEKRGIAPILDVRMAFHNRVFSISSLIAMLNYCTVVGQIFFFCLYLQFHFGLSMQAAGLCLGVQPFIQMLLSRSAGKLGDRYGSINITCIGLTVCAGALGMACTFAAHTHLATVIVSFILNGIGLSLFASPNNSTIMGSVDKAHLGQASGIIGTVRTTGMLISMVAASIAMSVYLGDAPASAERAGDFIISMHHCVVFYTALNGLALLLCLWLKCAKLSKTKETPDV